MPDLVAIEHTQSIAYEQDGRPQERLSISVRFTYEAFSSGWVKESFSGRGGPTDFLVMTAVATTVAVAAMATAMTMTTS